MPCMPTAFHMLQGFLQLTEGESQCIFPRHTDTFYMDRAPLIFAVATSRASRCDFFLSFKGLPPLWPQHLAASFRHANTCIRLIAGHTLTLLPLPIHLPVLYIFVVSAFLLLFSVSLFLSLPFAGWCPYVALPLRTSTRLGVRKWRSRETEQLQNKPIRRQAAARERQRDPREGFPPHSRKEAKEPIFLPVADRRSEKESGEEG